MITRVLGAIFIFLSSVAIVVNTFLFWNSSAYFDYNSEKLSMAKEGVFFPYFFAIIFFVFGVLLVKDKVLDNHH